MKKLLLASVVLMAGTAALAQSATVAPPAPAAPPPPMAHPMADKAMTRNEVVTMVRDHFGRLDADKNGSITTEEVMKSHGQRAERFKTMRVEHGEGDGPHVMQMQRRDPKEAFERMDANKDGAISFEEFSKAREQRFEKRIVMRDERKDGAKDSKLGEGRNFRMHRMGGPGGARMIVMADSDHDGKITLAEAEALALQHFDQMDTNHDGTVTPDERRAGRPMIIKKVIEEKKKS